MKGFTLVEVLLFSAAAMIVGSYLLSILVNNNNFSSTQNSIISNGLSLNDMTREIDNRVRQSAGVVSGYPETAPVYTTNAETLVLKLPAINTTGIINNVYDYIVIFKDSTNNNVLKMKTFPDVQSTRGSGELVLTTLLEAIEFKYLDKTATVVSPTAATSVSVEVKVLSKTGATGTSKSASMITTLRND